MAGRPRLCVVALLALTLTPACFPEYLRCAANADCPEPEYACGDEGLCVRATDSMSSSSSGVSVGSSSSSSSSSSASSSGSSSGQSSSSTGSTSASTGSTSGSSTSSSGASTSGGWQLTAALDNAITALAVSPTTPDTVYAGVPGYGVFRSTNAGDSWTEYNDGLMTDDDNVVSLAASEDRLFVSTTQRMYRRTLTTPWTTTGPTSMQTGDRVVLAADPQNADLVYAGSDRGKVWRSDSGASSWTVATAGLLELTRVNCIAVGGSNRVYVGGNGVFRSASAGETWQDMELGLTDVKALAEDSAFLGGALYIVDATGVYVYENFLLTPLGNVPSASTVALGQTVNGARVYVGANDGTNVLVYTTTHDELLGQQTPWTPTQVRGNAGSSFIWALAVAPGDTRRVYAALNSGLNVYRTFTGGQ
ncbi:MAG: hypothetical protein AB2A00_22770 [Myxococcota bacterium]